MEKERRRYRGIETKRGRDREEERERERERERISTHHRNMKSCSSVKKIYDIVGWCIWDDPL